MERTISSVCRAVAVRVAESSTRSKHSNTKGDKSEKVTNTMNITDDAITLAHPPEMPIVIDETALEDILGVRVVFLYYIGARGGSVVLN